MRRTNFITGIQQLHDALVESKLQALLSSMMEGPTDGPATTQVLSVLKEYSLEARQFNDAAHQLAHLLELDELESPETWSQLIDRQDASFIRHQYERVSVVTDYLPQVAALLQRSSHETLKAAGLSHQDGSQLTVVVVEQEDHLSSPQRLSELFAGMEKLYEVCAVAAGVHGDKLSVLGCDSGKDKAFDLVGTPEVINELKNLILSMWDRVVFFRERDLPERIERVAESLFMHQRIRTLEQEQTISPEQAEILRRALTNGVTKFMEAGAIIPEIEERAQYDPRRLMTPEPKLLVSGMSEGPALDSIDTQQTAAPKPEKEVETRSASTGAIAAPDRKQPPPSEEPLSPHTSDSETEHEEQISSLQEETQKEDIDQEAGVEEQEQPEPSSSADETQSATEVDDSSTAPHAEREEQSPDERDGVMEVLEAIAERHESEEGTKEAIQPENTLDESGTPQAENPAQTTPPTSEQEAASASPSHPGHTSEEQETSLQSQEPSSSTTSEEEENDDTEEDVKGKEDEKKGNRMKGLNKMFDRIGGGKHLFGNPEEEEDDSEHHE